MSLIRQIYSIYSPNNLCLVTKSHKKTKNTVMLMLFICVNLLSVFICYNCSLFVFDLFLRLLTITMSFYALSSHSGFCPVSIKHHACIKWKHQLDATILSILFHLILLSTWTSYTIPDCTCLKLLMMGGCNTQNM